MRLIEVGALKETLDKIPARSIENADGRTYVLIRLSTVFEIIKQMPSAQPERAVKDCRNCRYGGYNDHYCTYFCYCADECKDWDKWKPSAQPERPIGKWIVSESEEVGALGIRCKTYTCPSCGWDNSLIIPRNFCPNCGCRMSNCGADMRGEQDE